ncbi:MAG: hypothetical protein ACYCSQ_00250 [bacterium]
MLNGFFIETLNAAKEKTRNLLSHTKENGYRVKIGLPAALDKWDILNLKKYYKSFTEQEITNAEIIKNQLTDGGKFTRHIVKKAKEAGYPFTSDFELYASNAYDRKTEFYISTNPADLLSPSDFSSYKSCFADGGGYSHGVPKWALMPGVAILFSQGKGKKTSRAWLYFYSKGGKKGFLIFRNYGSRFDDEAMRQEIAKLTGIKKYRVKEYAGCGSLNDTYIDTFNAVREFTETAGDFKTLTVKEAFFGELERQQYMCPLCGQTEKFRSYHIACCGSITEALSDFRRVA